MTKFWDAYHIPASVDEAMELLVRHQGRARIVAGGTDLFLDLKGGYWEGRRVHYAALVDVTRIAGAREIRDEGGWIVAGCGVTHAQVAAAPVIRTRAAALHEAALAVAGPQVRNVGTLAGNIAHALPAADGLIALLVLGAEVQTVKAAGGVQAWRPLESLYLGPGRSKVDPTRELITAVRLRPTGIFEGSAFTRVLRPQGVALPVLAMAARVRFAAHGAALIEEASLSVGPVAPTPFRARRTEDSLRGQILDDAMLSRASRTLLEEAVPRTGARRATREYRCELLPGLMREVLTAASNRARLGSSS